MKEDMENITYQVRMKEREVEEVRARVQEEREEIEREQQEK